MAEENNKQPPKEKEAGQDKKPPIIIKKIMPAHHGHHGGAWKVAYADFVTAMMAFFLLLWLLNSVPTEKLKGIAQYFEPTIGIAGSKGIGFEGGRSQSDTGNRSYENTRGVIYGVMRKGNILDNPQQGMDVSADEAENQQFSLVEGELKKSILNDAETSSFQDSIEFEIKPEGLVIKIIDQDKYPMFKEGSAELQNYTKNILSKIVKLIAHSNNYLEIAGYTDSDASGTQKEYGNWELSADRANATRRYIISDGISIEQIKRVVAKADTEPLDQSNPYSSRNRRVTITLLRHSMMPYNKMAAPKELLGSPVQK
jgi:chemotaxis protein MotB